MTPFTKVVAMTVRVTFTKVEATFTKVVAMTVRVTLTKVAHVYQPSRQ